MISIIVPCYNCEKTFKRCVESICNQTQKEIEIILVDDGSSDGTYELCENAAGKDTRIKVYHQKNKGPMNATKRGVQEASGDYVIFSDSDDYLDLDLVEKLEEMIEKYHADIIAYGMKAEYEDHSIVYRGNLLGEGYYTRTEIEELILPQFFSNGNMESRILLASRWSKLFKRDLLLRNFDYLSDEIRRGEDALTVFASVLSADAIYCMKDYFPYHYMRNNDSAVGKYDAFMFQKILDLREQMFKIAGVYGYPYDSQIEADFLSNVFLCMKKEICRNKDAGCREICNRLRQMRENEVFIHAIQICSINKYNLMSRVFAYLVIHKRYLITYVMTKLMDLAGAGKA